MTLPNILYLHSHDTGRYIQPYGYAVPTPNLQQLAKEGVLFRQAFCAAPTCSPSRAALLTGQCAHSSGMLGLAHRGFALRDYQQHLVHSLRPLGYHSTLIGIQHVAADPAVIGYDRMIKTPNSEARHVGPAARDFLNSQPAQPFFLNVGFFETHREFPEPAATDDPPYSRPPAPLPDTAETRLDMAAYKASAHALDTGIGTVLAALEANGLAANTLVIYTTDHGPAFPNMKCNLTDHGIGVALILRGPGGLDGGIVCDGMVSHVDLFPTVCDLIGAPHPPWLQGQSIMPLVDGDVHEIHSEIFAEVTYHAAYEPQRAVRSHRYKYIRRFGNRRRPVLPNCDDSPSKVVWLRHAWRDRVLPTEQLYDLVFDPNEQDNLADSPGTDSILRDMRSRLDRWMQATADPLLHGPVTAPPGTRVNDPDGLSPREPVQIAGGSDSVTGR